MLTESARGRLLIALLQDDPDYDSLSRQLQKLESRDWPALTNFAKAKGLLPAVCDQILKSFQADIPLNIFNDLTSIYMQNLNNNLRLEKELFDILALFTQAGVMAIPLKGPFLANYLYRDLAHRQSSCDLDILIKKDSIQKAKEALKEIGYYTNTDKETFLLKFKTQISFIRKNTEGETLALDLHWGLRNGSIVGNLEEFWQSSVEVNMNGHMILTASLEDLALYLSMAALIDAQGIRIKYAYDLHKLFSGFSKEVDHKRLWEKAKRRNMQSMLGLMLSLIKKIFRTNIQTDLLSKTRPDILKMYLTGFFAEKSLCRQSFKIRFWPGLISPYLCSTNIMEMIRAICRLHVIRRAEAAWSKKNSSVLKPKVAKR